MSDVIITVIVDEKFKTKLEKLAEEYERSLAGQIRWMLEKALSQ